MDTTQHTVEVLKKSQIENTFPYDVETLGVSITVFENVFSPKYFGDSEWIADHLPKTVDVKDKNVLEIGTGTGLIAIKLVHAGAKKVVATDIVEHTLNNARFNVEKLGLSDAIELRLGDAFEPVKKDKFDVIYWNIPFTYVDDAFVDSTGIDKGLAASCFSPDYRNFRIYLQNGFDYLNPNGRLILGFSPGIGNDDMLTILANELGLKMTILKDGHLDFDNADQHIQILEFKKD